MEMRSQQSWNQCGVISLLSKDVQASESQILFLLMTRFDNDSFSSVQSGTFLHAAWNPSCSDYQEFAVSRRHNGSFLVALGSQHSIHS
jgi:hypothetical protein